MSSVTTALRTILLADVDVAAITTQVKPKLPQDPTLPVITYKQVSHPTNQAIDFGTPRIQIEAHAETYAGAEELSNVIALCLQRYKGRVGGVRIERISFLNEIDNEDPATGRQSRIADYRVQYREE